MARFRGTIKGNKGEVSRLGSKESGMVANINGWLIGVKIVLSAGENILDDSVNIYLTTGSSPNHKELFLGRFKLDAFKEEKK